MRVAICFSCNEAYIPLCKGLVLSLKDVNRFARGFEFSLCFIDIGCEDDSLAWLEEHGVNNFSFSRLDYPVLPRQDLLPHYADAQLCRPFLPEIVPGYDAYIWIDCDIWHQSREAATDTAAALGNFKDKVVICPEHHYGYIGHRSQRNSIALLQYWYKALYKDEALAESLSFAPIFNTGYFAMSAGSPLWGAWAEELSRVYAGDHSKDPSVLHYAEQLALNKLIQERNALIPLDPVYNYACGGSAVFLNPAGKVVVGYPPCSPVKGAHLLDFSRYGNAYLQKGLLYDQGRYLSQEERARLSGLVKKG